MLKRDHTISREPIKFVYTTRYCKTLQLGWEKPLMFVPVVTTYSVVARLANQKETKQVT